LFFLLFLVVFLSFRWPEKFENDFEEKWAREVMPYLKMPWDPMINFSEPQLPVWEMFDLPFGPEHDQDKFEEKEEQERLAREEQLHLNDTSNIDYDSLHPACSFRLMRDFPGLFPFTKTNHSEPIHIPEFKWEGFEDLSTLDDLERYPDFVDYDEHEENWVRLYSTEFKKFGRRTSPRIGPAEEMPMSYRHLNNDLLFDKYRDYDGPDRQRLEMLPQMPLKRFKVPQSWLKRSRYKDYQTIDEFNKDFTYTDIDTDDDLYTVMSLVTILDLMNLYTEDQFTYAEAYDRRFAIDRWLHTRNNIDPNATFPVMEPIPSKLMPEKDRGVNYTSEIIEMFTNVQLLPVYDNWTELYANSSWDYPVNVRSVELFGSVLENYEWEPQLDLLPYVIEPEKMEAIRPIIRYLNFEAKLLSTKVSIYYYLVFLLL
jgi:hypothetical protein